MLDFTVTADEFGKPVNADLKLGLATAPVLYASEKYPELIPLIERQFEQSGDVEKVIPLHIHLFIYLFIHSLNHSINQ